MYARFSRLIAVFMLSAPLAFACTSTQKDDDDDAEGVGGEGGMCAQKLESCTSNGECCGYESGNNFCVNTGSGAICAIACSSGSQCASGCCASLEGGGSVCAPAQYCEPTCRATGTSCTKNGDCCGFKGGDALCVSGICAATCSYGSDCKSGCCAMLTSGSRACGPASVCG
jgi:hypothetical protein